MYDNVSIALGVLMDHYVMLQVFHNQINLKILLNCLIYFVKNRVKFKTSCKEIAIALHVKLNDIRPDDSSVVYSPPSVGTVEKQCIT